MKRNLNIHKSEAKKLVITNDHHNLFTNMQFIEKNNSNVNENPCFNK